MELNFDSGWCLCSINVLILFTKRPKINRNLTEKQGFARKKGQLRIPGENGHHSGGKTATVPLGKRPAFRCDCGHHSGEFGQCIMRE